MLSPFFLFKFFVWSFRGGRKEKYAFRPRLAYMHAVSILLFERGVIIRYESQGYILIMLFGTVISHSQAPQIYALSL